MNEASRPILRRFSSPGASVLLLIGLSAWLWPIGLGGRMPVGGDVTQFSIGLMAFLHDALRSWRLPLWNDLWGYGFPGLAESQMGVYYPPHWLLYGILPTEAAYTASLVLHTFWAGLGAAWASRRFGASPAASTLGGFVWASSGFFVNHLTHQWGYTTGSWMPWAWGLAWGLARGRGGRREALWLAAILAWQVLPGHFQLAFITQMTVLAIGLWGLLDRGQGPEEPARSAPRTWGALRLVLSGLAAGLLTACQLLPTWELAQRAETDRTWEYLSGFAHGPIHLISYVAPGLFHRSPLWRPLAWDPFHTSPEETLGYVGLVPLWLAGAFAWREWRRNPAARALAVVALLSLSLSLGPYLPGFSLLIQLPGFGLFRAPARWGLAFMLALAILASLGFDRLRSWGRVRSSLFRFLIVAAVLPLLGLAVVELALASTERPGLPAVADGFEEVRRLLPWSRSPDNDEPDFRQIMAEVRRPPDNPIVQAALGRRGLDPASRFDHERWSIYRLELGETAALLVALGVLAIFARRPRVLAVGLVILTVVDLFLLGRHRDVDLGPIRSLVEQSPVLQRLAEESRTTRGRSVGPLGNLPMIAGASPLIAYRTLDVPALSWLGQMAGLPVSGYADPGRLADAMRMAGATVRLGLADPSARIEGFQGTTIDDPALAGWLQGQRAARDRGATSFRILQLEEPTSRAWLISRRSATAFDPGRTDPTTLDWFVSAARPLPWRSEVPEEFVVEGIEVPEVEPPNEGLVVISRLDDPGWRAVWVGPDGQRPAEIIPVFAERGEAGWQGARVPGPGRWTLHLRYEGRAAKVGLAVSTAAWIAWIALWSRSRPGRSNPDRRATV